MATPTFPKLIFHSIKASIANGVGVHVKNAGPHYDMDPRAKNILIVYRIYYKSMTTSINAKCLLKSLKWKTLLFQANEEQSLVMTPEEIP